jgi:hypothetical protein
MKTKIVTGSGSLVAFFRIDKEKLLPELKKLLHPPLVITSFDFEKIEIYCQMVGSEIFNHTPVSNSIDQVKEFFQSRQGFLPLDGSQGIELIELKRMQLQYTSFYYKEVKK